MSYEKEKEVLEGQIEELNEEIRRLGYRISELLNVDCTLGVCTFDPEVDNVQDKIKEVEEKKRILERLKKTIGTC